MRGGLLLFSILFFVAVAPIHSLRNAQAQSAGGTEEPHTEAVLTKLHDPIYPPVARVARVYGDVKLTLSIERDGTVESVNVVSGHPLLQQAAIVSAQQSKFECQGCADSTSYSMVYTFQLGPAIYCETTDGASKAIQPEELFPRVTQTRNHVILFDRPVGTCDLEPELHRRVHSAKCLYLWRCGVR
jgi:TonB family protein